MLGILPIILVLFATPPAKISLEPKAVESTSEEWNTLAQALKLYREEFGDLVIEDQFVVPAQQPWPEPCWGLKLGPMVYSIQFWKRHVARFPARRTELDSIGFIWGRLQSHYNLIVEALLAYKELYGDLNVPIKFICPSKPPWSSAVWKLPLGARVSAIRSRGHYVGKDTARWAQLEAMGFVWEPSDASWERLHLALVHYRTLHAHVNVPRDFTVPSAENNTDGWPESLGGFRIGVAVHNLRARGAAKYPERLALLKDLGFVWDPSAAAFDLLCVGLEAFKAAHGHTRVPQLFVVPSEPPWPQACWGFKLGSLVSSVRTRGSLVKFAQGRTSSEVFSRIRRLNALEFDWDPPRGNGKRRTVPLLKRPPAPAAVVADDFQTMPVGSSSSRYRGVSWYAPRCKWKAQIYAHGKQTTLGRFATEEEAARKYDEAAAPLGRPLNFPEEHTWRSLLGERAPEGAQKDAAELSGAKQNLQFKKWRMNIRCASLLCFLSSCGSSSSRHWHLNANLGYPFPLSLLNLQTLCCRQSRQDSEEFLGVFEGDEEAFRTYEAVQAAAEAAEALLEVLEKAEAGEALGEGTDFSLEDD